MAGTRSIYSSSLWLISVATILATVNGSSANLLDNLCTDFYQETCPHALETIQGIVESEVRKEPRMGASLLRLHFHDCFVNGCDGSILLDDTSTIQGEKTAPQNDNSVRGYEVVDEIKQQLNQACGGPIVSCADILAIAARDSVVALGGPTWEVRLGRRDSTTASRAAATDSLPGFSMDLPALLDNFGKQGLDERDLVALSGGHTLGLAQCITFRNRTYNDTNIDPTFAAELRRSCPASGGDGNLQPLDPTPFQFDTRYFENMVIKRGLLHSDQALFNGGGSTDERVRCYVEDPELFAEDFARSMVKMGNIRLLTGAMGQVRVNCRRVN